MKHSVHRGDDDGLVEHVGRDVGGVVVSGWCRENRGAPGAGADRRDRLAYLATRQSCHAQSWSSDAAAN